MNEYVFCLQLRLISENGIRAEKVLIPISRIAQVCGPDDSEYFPNSDRVYDYDGTIFYCAQSRGNDHVIMSDFPGSIVTVAENSIYFWDGIRTAKLGPIEFYFGDGDQV